MSASILRAAVVTLLASATLACEDPAALDDFFILITNQWAEVGNEDHVFDFTADDGVDGGTEGSFTGTETDDGQEFELTGSWADNQVTFTVQRSPAVTYTAPLTADDLSELLFQSSAGQLRLRKQG